MSGETTITVIGNLTADPELRFTPSGAAVANGTIASTPRTFDKTTNEWKDGETLFVRYSVWREAAEYVTESLTKGQRVIAQGFLKPKNWETKEGEKRSGMELEISDIGPSLKYSKAVVTRQQNSNGGGGQPNGFGGSQQPAQQAQGGWNGQQAPAQGGYQQAPQQGAQGGWNQTAAQQAVTQQAQGGQYAGGSMAQPQQQADPWANPGAGNQPQGGQWGNGPQGEPPF